MPLTRRHANFNLLNKCERSRNIELWKAGISFREICNGIGRTEFMVQQGNNFVAILMPLCRGTTAAGINADLEERFLSGSAFAGQFSTSYLWHRNASLHSDVEAALTQNDRGKLR